MLVMFSGCAPYPIVIAKNAKPAEIAAVELNPVAYDYAVENVKLNKANNVTLFEGDVNEVVPILHKKFDRILMPLARPWAMWTPKPRPAPVTSAVFPSRRKVGSNGICGPHHN